jgi:hypothetical protein
MERERKETESCSFLWIKFGQGTTRGKRIKQLKCVKKGQGRGEGLKDVKSINNIMYNASNLRNK